MKSQVSTPSSSSSVKSSTTMMQEEEEDRSESRDSCYFPGCRKDANCNCDICLASINATLDLLPISIQKNPLTKFSSSKSIISRSPVSFNPSILSTPVRNKQCVFESPSLKSTARIKKKNEDVRKEKEVKWDLGIWFLRLFLALGFAVLVEFGFPWVVSGVLQPEMSQDVVKNLGERAWSLNDLRGKLGVLERGLQGITNGRVLNCSHSNSRWEVNQNGLLLHSSCALYKSATEEVRIWGWPLQTSGLLTTGFSSRSFTILSGRVTEWPDGKAGYVIRKANSSWIQDIYRASAVQLDRNTWVLEYQRSLIMENKRLSSAASQFLKFKLSSAVGRMKQTFQFFSISKNRFCDFHAECRRITPT